MNRNYPRVRDLFPVYLEADVNNLSTFRFITINVTENRWNVGLFKISYPKSYSSLFSFCL
jgi:hypothetical protein